MSQGEYGYWIMQLLALAGVIAISIFTVQHRKGKEEYLCGDCHFNNPTACLKKERPYAMDCTSYSANITPENTHE
jgi:hypothetical protein